LLTKGNLLFCQKSPTVTCVAGNCGVGSSRDNEASAHGLATDARADVATASITAVGS